MTAIRHPYFQINENTWAFSEFGLSSMYLLTGTEKALLIDTGLGSGNLAEEIRKMTDLPLVTVITHGHIDHAGSAGFFDEVYISLNDVDLMRNTISTEKRRTSFRGSCARRSLPVPINVEETITDWDHTPNLKFLQDRYMIDLGGRVIQAIAVPGHTKGSMAFLDRKNRILFSGDACNINLVLAKPVPAGQEFDPAAENAIAKYAASIKTYLNSLQLLKNFSDQFDRNYPGHLDDVNNIPEKNGLIDELIQCCENIIAKGIPAGCHPNMPCREQAGRASITYLPGRINQ